MQVHRRRAHVSFGAALILGRPDVVMVGAIRDPETATIAVEASLTGHRPVDPSHQRRSSALTPPYPPHFGANRSSPPRR